MMHIRDNTVHEIQVAIGYETCSINQKHVLTLGLLKQLIGEWSSQSLAGTLSCFNDAFSIVLAYVPSFEPYLILA